MSDWFLTILSFDLGLGSCRSVCHSDENQGNHAGGRRAQHDRQRRVRLLQHRAAQQVNRTISLFFRLLFFLVFISMLSCIYGRLSPSESAHSIDLCFISLLILKKIQLIKNKINYFLDFIHFCISYCYIYWY